MIMLVGIGSAQGAASAVTPITIITSIYRTLLVSFFGLLAFVPALRA